MNRHLLSTFLLLFAITIANAQKVKIKKEVILLDKAPTYQIQEGEKLDRFETYIFTDMKGEKVLIATPKYMEFVQLIQEEKPYQMPYYEVNLPDGSLVAELEFFPIGYRKRLVNFLVEQKMLGKDNVGAALEEATAAMVLTTEERKKLEGYNENRKSLTKAVPFKRYATNLLVSRNPVLSFYGSGLYYKVGTIPIAYAKLVEANFGSDRYLYDIHSAKKQNALSTQSSLLAKITFNKKSKEFKVIRVYDNSEFSFKIDSFFEEKYLEQIAEQLFLEGLL